MTVTLAAMARFGAALAALLALETGFELGLDAFTGLREDSGLPDDAFFFAFAEPALDLGAAIGRRGK